MWWFLNTPPPSPSHHVLKKEGETHVFGDIQAYMGTEKSEAAWISTVLKFVTLTDKMSAYVVPVRTSPIHQHPVLEQLISYLTLKSCRSCLMAIARAMHEKR
jgi:hypothetical protein